MSRTITKPCIEIDLDGVDLKGGVTFTHDFALRGDEDLHVGQRVEIVDEAGAKHDSTVIKRDEAEGYWLFRLESENV